MATVQERVAAGVQLLDEEAAPGWREKISIQGLRMDSRSRCVLGQVFGYYDDGLARLGLIADYDGYNDVDYTGAPYGFMVEPREALSDDSFSSLRDAWVAELTKDQEARKFADFTLPI